MSDAAGSSTITLDRERRLRFDVNAIAAFEERFGDRPIWEIIAPGEPVGTRKIRELLYAGLLDEDPSMTPTKAGALLHGYLKREGDMTALTRAVLEAVQADTSFGKKAAPAERDSGNAGAPAATS